MTDSMHQPRDENGQFISIGTLFERERQEHGRDHERERLVMQATAERLEREVEETARRLERLVDETAMRLEKGVSTALDAVGKTAIVHSDAHNREHQAHERIHSVEKLQVDKAEEAMNKRLEGMNEFRDALSDQANRAVTREYYDTRHEDLKEKVIALEKRSVSQEAVDAYKRVVYGAVVVGAVSLLIAVFNLLTRT